MAGVLHGPSRIGVAIFERVRVGRGCGHQADDARPHAGIQIHSDERDGKTDVPAIGDAVVRKRGGRMRRGFERERRFDEIALEGRVQMVGAGEGSQRETGQVCRVFEVATILMAQIELDRAVVETLPLERVVRRALVVESGAQLPPADREGALGKQRPEAHAATPEGADRFVEHVGHAACRRSERERRELRGHLRVEALDDADDGIIQIAGLDRAEVRHVRRPQ